MRNERDSLDAILPLKPADLQILLVLSSQNLHGYGIMKAVERQSEGRVRLELGSLYRLIARLETAGLISGRAGTPGDARRKYYALADLGRSALRIEAGRLENLLQRMRAAAICEDSEGIKSR